MGETIAGQSYNKPEKVYQCLKAPTLLSLTTQQLILLYHKFYGFDVNMLEC